MNKTSSFLPTPEPSQLDWLVRSATKPASVRYAVISNCWIPAYAGMTELAHAF